MFKFASITTAILWFFVTRLFAISESGITNVDGDFSVLATTTKTPTNTTNSTNNTSNGKL